MAKKAIKSEKLTPFGGIFAMMEQFDSTLSYVIDTTLGLRGIGTLTVSEYLHRNGFFIDK